MRFGRRTAIIFFGLWLWLVGPGLAPLALAQALWSYSSDGSEVRDLRTGLTWRRCSEGQVWDSGSCAGTASGLTHENALALAKTKAGWRLPNAKELASLLDLRQNNPAIDSSAFPSTPSELFWTSSPVVGNSAFARFVSFGEGGAVSHARRTSYYRVRLVK